MIYDLLEVFKKEYDEKGDKLIFDNYELKEGIYIKVSNDNSFKAFTVKKKNRETIFSDINGGLNSREYEWFKERDYYSDVISNRKVLDAPKKIIHNNNYLSLYMKVEQFNLENLEHIKKNLYSKLLNFSFKDKHEIKLVKEYKELNTCKRKRDVVKKYKFLKNNMERIGNLSKDNEITNYIKIFFDAPLDRYKEESSIYFSIKLFNKNIYSKYIDNLIYGLPDSNIGLGDKKPFLKNLTRQTSTPFLILKEDALLAKKFFDWLKFQKYMDKTPLSSEFFLNRDFREKDLIIDFDYLPVKIDRFQNPIEIKNHLMLKKGKVLIEDETIEYLYLLEDKIDEVLYNRQLKNNYYGEVYKKLDNSFASFIYSTRDAMSGYFKKYDDRAFYQVIEKYATHLAIEHLIRGRFLQAGLSLNLKFSLRKKKEDTMNIKEMQEKIIDRIEDGDYSELSVDEFFYISGQMARYLISQSEAHQKNGDLLESYLRANSSAKLKRVIESEYFKYKHAISLGYVKFNNAMSLIMSYEENDKLSLSKNMDSFLVGALSENIFYMKKSEE